MFTIKIASNNLQSAQKITNTDSEHFKQLLKRKWDEIHEQPDVFRYNVNKMRERIVDNRYILLLNPDRGFKRREPEFIDSIDKPFNPNEFNFNKASLKEHLFIMHELNNADTHLFLVNVSPITRYHTLLCPSVNKCLPQVVTVDSIRLVLKLKFLAQDRDLKIGFNSLCAFASVNHLHYHLLYEKNMFHVSTDYAKLLALLKRKSEGFKAKKARTFTPEELNMMFIDNAPDSIYLLTKECSHIKGPLYVMHNVVPAFCFEVTKETMSAAVSNIYKLTKYFVTKSIGHNILVTDGEPVSKSDNNVTGEPLVPGAEDFKVVRVLVTPRLSTAGIKQLTSFNVAVLELSGWFPVFNPEYFDTFGAEDLENELSKWKLPNFEELCVEIKSIY